MIYNWACKAYVILSVDSISCVIISIAFSSSFSAWSLLIFTKFCPIAPNNSRYHVKYKAKSITLKTCFFSFSSCIDYLFCILHVHLVYKNNNHEAKRKKSKTWSPLIALYTSDVVEISAEGQLFVSFLLFFRIGRRHHPLCAKLYGEWPTSRCHTFDVRLSK